MGGVAAEAEAPLPPDLSPVLVVMVDYHLGNVAISLPVIAALAEHFEGGVDVLADERYVPLVELLPGDVRAIGCPARFGGGAVLRWAGHLPGVVGRLRGRRYRAVIDLTGNKQAALVTAGAGARRRVGMSTGPLRWAYTRRIERRGAVHELERYSRLLECVGREGPAEPVRLAVSEAAGSRLAERLAGEAAGLPERWAVFHVGAGMPSRVWPLDRFAQVADALGERHGLGACLIGSPGERGLMDEVKGAMRRPERAVSLHVPLDELAAVFEHPRSAVLISNESGPTHVAALTGLPIVTIFGPSNERRWRPVRERGVRVLRGASCDPGCRRRHCAAGRRCLLNTTVEDVLAAAEGVMGKCGTGAGG